MAQTKGPVYTVGGYTSYVAYKEGERPAKEEVVTTKTDLYAVISTLGDGDMGAGFELVYFADGVEIGYPQLLRSLPG